MSVIIKWLGLLATILPSVLVLLSDWSGTHRSLWSQVLLSVILLAGSVLLYWAMFVPMNRVLRLEDVGYKHIPPGKLKRDEINRSRRLRQRGECPPPFPNGWFVLLESRELGTGEIRHVQALGLNLAVFRGSSGEVFITEAYCPHLGANLAVGGRVSGDCIQCPFHNWKFSGKTGACEKKSTAKGDPPKAARLRKFVCLERNQLIMTWHHSQDILPHWEPPVLVDVDKGGSWLYQGRSEYYVNSHIQDISENGADPVHLSVIHRTGILVGGEPSAWLERKTEALAIHAWDAVWKRDETESHIARISLKHTMMIFNRFPVFSLDVRVEQIGPALVYLHFYSRLGHGVMIQYVLPVEGLVQKLVHVFYTQPSWIPPYAKFVLFGESIHLERDIRVWNSKTYQRRPMLSKEDAYILEHRRWYRQFYSDRATAGNSQVAHNDPTFLDW